MILLNLEDAKAKALGFEGHGRVMWSLKGGQHHKSEILFDTVEEAISQAERSSIFMLVYFHVAEMINIERIILDHIEHDFSGVLRTHYSDYGDSFSLDLPVKIGIELEDIQAKLTSILRELDIYHTCMCFEVDISPYNLTVSALSQGERVEIDGEIFVFIAPSQCGDYGAFWVGDTQECRSFPSETQCKRVKSLATL